MLDVDMVARATLNGTRLDAHLINAITELKLDLTMDLANQLTVTVEDADSELLRSALLAGDNGAGGQIDLQLPGAGRWRMNRPRDVGGLSIYGTTAELRFWDIGAAALQEQYDPMTKAASDLDLLGWVKLLAREVRSEVDLRAVVPAPGEVPHLEEETAADRVGRGRVAGGRGWPPRAAAQVRVKGRRASAAQLRNMDAAFTEAIKHDPPALAMLTLAAAITQESNWENVQGDPPDDVSWGLVQNIPGTSAGVSGIFTQAQALDIPYTTRSALLPPGPTSAGGLIKVANERPTLDPGTLADIVINGLGVGDPLYVPHVNGWVPEARRNIELWTGRRFDSFRRGGGDDGRTEGVAYKPAQWRRGTARGGREGSWKTLGRYAEQLGRRRFVAGPTTPRPVLVMAQDQQLIRATPHIVVPLDDDELIVERPTVDLIGRERLERIEFTVLRSGWSAPPGAVADIANGGPLDGPWVVLDVGLESGEPTATVTLTQPVTRRQPDPARSRAARRGRAGSTNGRGAEAAIEWATARIGVREVGINRGRDVEAIITGSGGQIGEPYCGYFCGGALKAAGLSVPSSIGSVQWIYDSAAARRAPFHGATTAAHGAPGDLAVIGAPNQHVELIVRVDATRQIVHTIGGNTTLPDGGQGVAAKERSFGSVVRVAQVAYR